MANHDWAKEDINNLVRLLDGRAPALAIEIAAEVFRRDSKNQAHFVAIVRAYERSDKTSENFARYAYLAAKKILESEAHFWELFMIMALFPDLALQAWQKLGAVDLANPEKVGKITMFFRHYDPRQGKSLRKKQHPEWDTLATLAAWQLVVVAKNPDDLAAIGFVSQDIRDDGISLQTACDKKARELASIGPQRTLVQRTKEFASGFLLKLVTT